MEYVAQVAGKIVDCTVGKVGEQLGYLIDYKDNIEALKENIEILKGKREELQQKITEAENNLEIIHGHVKTWDEHVVEITKDVDNLLEDDQKEATHRCFNGWCINLWARYKFGKKASEKVDEIKKKLQEAKFDNVSSGLRDSTVTKPSSSKEMFRGLESRKEMVRDIMKALDDENINIIGICGMGGVGKTTIVNKVRTQAEEQKKFDKTVMVVVSQNPKLTNIQDGIAKELGLHLEQRNTSSSRTAALWNRIKKVNKIMIILDDVWKRLDLIEDVGIPFGEEHKGCKIVLTTREEDVCKEMNVQSTFIIQSLSAPEDWLLFKEAVGEEVESSELKSIASEVVRGCRGLPIAIVTVGMALKGRNKDVWIDAKKQLKKPLPNKIKGMHKEVYARLDLSYRYIESNEAKSLFLLCSLFPEDFEIDVGLLAQYGMGLRLFEDVNTIEDGRVRSHSLVRTLISSFLLLKGWRDGLVKMHDVVRDAAIVIASTEEEKKYMVKTGVGLRDWPNREMTASFQSYTGISLMHNDIHELPDKLESTKLQVLLLQNNSDQLDIPTNFFQGMENLKVLDMGGNGIRFMPTSIKWLTSLKTLCLDGCKLGDNISIIGTLQQLEILNLRGSDIKEVPGNFCQLTRLMSLDLRKCNDLKKITSGVISSLCKLEELYITFHFTYWAGIEGGEDSRSNASLAELKSLPRLTSLSICVPNVNLLPYDLKLRSLTEFDIILGHDEYYRIVGYHVPVNRKLALSYDTANYRLSAAVHDLLKRTKSLILIDCKGSTNIFKDFDNNEDFVELEYLFVRECNDMEYLFVKLHNQLRYVRIRNCPKIRQLFPPSIAQSLVHLEYLEIYDCENMEEIFGTYNEDGINQTSAVGKSLNTNMSFTNLVTVKVRECYRLRQLFPPSIAQSLVHLETLEIWKCENMEEIFGTYNEDGINQTSAVGKSLNTNMSFTNLVTVSVELCYRLRQLFPPSIAQSLVHLEKLNIWNCENMEEIFGTYNEDGINQTSAVGKSLNTNMSLTNLVTVKVIVCYRLRQLFPPSIAQSLIHLETLEIWKCENMEEIFGTYNEDGINQTSAVGKSLNTNMSFTNLVTVHVSRCNRLRNIFTPSIAKGLAQLTELRVGYCGMMKAVIELEDDPRKEGDEAQALSAENITLFPRLVKIELFSLENICCFCTSRSTITFPSLQELEIRWCPKMETFGNGVVITPNLNKVDVRYWDAGVREDKSEEIWKGELNATVQHMFNNHERYQQEPSTTEELQAEQLSES